MAHLQLYPLPRASVCFTLPLVTEQFTGLFRNEGAHRWGFPHHFQFFNHKFCFVEAVLPITYGLRSLASIDWLPFHEIVLRYWGAMET